MSAPSATARRIFVMIVAVVWIATAGRPLLAEEVRPAIQVVSAVSQRFQAEVERVWCSIPPAIRREVQQAGWQVKVAEYVVDAAPELATAAPRGWPAGMSWRHVDAVHLPRQRLLVVAEKRWTMQGECVQATRTAGVLRHELGHAYDRAEGGTGVYLSNSPAFRSAYDRDLAKFNSQQNQRLGYYLQAGAAGRQEAFAEAFALLLGGGSDPPLAADFNQAFPSVLECVRGELKEAEAVAAVRTP